MEIAHRFKNFVASIVNLMLQLWFTSDPLPATPPQSPPSPPALDLEAQAATVVVAQEDQRRSLNWPKTVIAFCLSSGLEIALQSLPNGSELPLTFNLMCLAILFAFASLVVAVFIGSKFPVPARVLELVGVFFAATAFFLAITIPFPLRHKCIAWAVYAICLLAIMICNRF
ncbi:hypothetical protein L1049_028022 [Liquidambar formosana]|uniref:Uncharacterized protein n=1 Tax=Liquidambar formosana TaxID=63359 RepID=A0AAP0RIB4_LIQFO